MATIHVPGTGVGPHGGKHARRTAVIAAVVLAFIAIVVPFGVRELDRDRPHASAAAGVQAPSPAPLSKHRHATKDAGVGPRGGLPEILPARARLTDGMHVRLGDITSGVMRRTPEGTWQVLVRWDGRLQPVTTRGPVGLGGGSAAVTSWVSDKGLLYTRVATQAPGQFRVYAWDPRGGTAYTPPTLVATHLGRVCFNRSFTAFGDCKAAG